MKKITGWILVLLVTLLCTAVLADVAIDEEHFPDANFRDFVQDIADSNGDGMLTDAEIAEVRVMECYYREIADLTGIQYFDSLTELVCCGNDLTFLNVSGNTKLTYLNCFANHLTSLDVSMLTGLETLICSDNEFTTLDLSHNAALTILRCYKGKLTALDLSANSRLEEVLIDNNQITSFNPGSSAVLAELDVSGNQLGSLDLSRNTGLQSLNVNGNRLSRLDLGKNRELITLDAGGNKMTTLDITQNTKLSQLLLVNTPVTWLDIRKCPNLLEAFHALNGVAIVYDSSHYAWENGDGSYKLVIPRSTRLYTDDSETTPPPAEPATIIAAIHESVFPDAAFREWVRQYDTDGDGGLCQDELDEVTEMKLGDCGTISSLKGIEYFTALTDLRVPSHQLTELEIRTLTRLKSLMCSGNRITSLDVSTAPDLTSLDCRNNALASLKLGGNDGLRYLYCYGNQFTSLDVSGCRDLNQMAMEHGRQTGNDSYDTFQNPLSQTVIIYNHGVPYEHVIDLSWYLQVDKTVTVLTTGGSIPPSVNPATPTPEPTATPTVEPTATPTMEPTATPTAEPTATPTADPTVGPTEGPVTQVTWHDGVYTLSAKTATLTGTTKSSLTSLDIPTAVSANGRTYKVTAIGAGACKGMKKLATVSIGKNVKIIEKNAFASCTKLKTVRGGAAVTMIGDSAFSGCKGLKTFPAMSKLAQIGANAFRSCVKLAKFTLGTAVKSIGKNAFNGCSGLKNFTVKTTKLKDSNVGAGAFKGIYKKAVFKCPPKKLKAYKALFIKKGAPKTCTFK